MENSSENAFETLNKSPEKLISVLKRRGGMRVSMFLPVTSKPPQSDQNVILLKELHQEALAKLKENGLTSENAETFVKPVNALIADPKLLLRPAEGLALLIDEASASLIELPYAVKAFVTVGNRYVLKPLLPLLQHDSDFTTACLNRGQVRIFEGTRLGIREVEVPDMPTSIEDVTKYDDPEKSLQHHTAKTGATEGAPGSSPVAAMHGKGLPSDLEKSQNERFFRDVANALKKYLANNRAPLILFGVDENIGLLSSSTDWSDHEVFSIHQDPNEWSEHEILRHATEALRPYWKKKIEEKVERLEEAYNKDSGVFDTGECVLAAANGRVEMVCVASEKREPGICRPEEMKVEFVQADDAGCVYDLLDTIAYETIQNGGKAFALPSDQIPGPGNSAATVRFEI